MPQKNILLADAIPAYAAHVRATGVAANTQKNKLQVLTRAYTVWGNINCRSITPAHVDRLFSDGDWSTATRNLYLGNLRLFLEWCRHHGYMPRDEDPTFGWRNQRVARTDRLRLPVHMFPALLDAATHPRDRAILALGLFTFMRSSEIETLKVSDLDLSASELRIYRHKTRQADVLPVSEELRVEMVRWLNYYRADQGGLDGNWLLTPAKYGPRFRWVDGQKVRIDPTPMLRPMSRVTHVYEIAQAALDSLGYDIQKEGIHTLRRSGARALVDRLRSEGTDSALLRVASMLGHSDIRVTMNYVGLDTERQQRNALIGGQRMFPQLEGTTGLRIVGGDHG